MTGSSHSRPGTSVRTIRNASTAPSGTAITVMPDGDQQRGAERRPEIRIAEDEGVGAETQSRVGRKERRQ